MIEKYIIEFIGTLIFVIVILSTGNPIAIAVTLLSMIYLGGAISGGNFNPAVSLSNYLNNKMSGIELTMFISLQLLAGYLGYKIYKLYYENITK